MHEAIAFLLRETGSKLIEAVVNRAFERRPDAAVAPPTDPVAEAQGAMDAFLNALHHRDTESMVLLCEPYWGEQPDTATLLDATLASAPPVSWGFQTLHVPDDWRIGEVLPWLVAELVVTFDIGNGFETIPAAMRAVNGAYGWRIDWLEWGAPEPAPVEVVSEDAFGSLSDFFDVHYRPATHDTVTCANCAQRLRVPTNKGRLRVRCPRCSNSQWYQP